MDTYGINYSIIKFKIYSYIYKTQVNLSIMTTYQQWNEAIIRYACQGLSAGSHVFLSIDEEVLATIGFTFGEAPPHGWKYDFIQTVRQLCAPQDQISLSRFTNPSLRNSVGIPRYVGFLALMVLAAHDMGNSQEDKPIDPKDYFTHFNKMLGLSDQKGRTKGLDAGEDERLWLDWADWLREQGFLPTAQAGEASYRYIRYPISQTLLRQSDKNQLWQHFTKRNYRKNYDQVLLMQRIRTDLSYLNKHLNRLFSGEAWQRFYEALAAACYDVYEEWRETGGQDRQSTVSAPRLRNSLDAKVYRYEDFFAGITEYRLFPRQVRQAASAQLAVHYQETEYPLIEDRAGWYQPLWPLNEAQLSNGLEVPIDSPNSPIKTLFLPARDFWILTLDPDTPDSGIYASWDKGIELGTDFILLARASLQDDLNKLKKEGILDWEEPPSNVFGDWYEYTGVTILSAEDWKDIKLQNEALLLTLQPHSTFSINLIGGIRAPRGAGWLQGYPPQLSVASFYLEAEFSIFTDLDSKQALYSYSIEVGQLITLPNLPVGTYRLVVKQEGTSEEKYIRILDWETLDPRPLAIEEIADELGLQVYGALVRE